MSRTATAAAVGDDVGDLRGVVAAVALVDVLDDLLAQVGFDVDVDVGRPVARRGQEPSRTADSLATGSTSVTPSA